MKVIDDDPAPVVSKDDAEITASPMITAATVTVRLDRPRDRDLPVAVGTPVGMIDVIVPALEREATGTLVTRVRWPAIPLPQTF